MSRAAAISGTSNRTLLYVHGRDFKPAAIDLLDICIAAMKAGIKRDYPDAAEKFYSAGKQLAWYGDLNYEIQTAAGRDYDEALDLGDRRNALQTLAAIDKRKNFGVHRYDRVPGKTAIAEFAAGVVGPVLGKLGLSTALIAKVCAELGAYWDEDSDYSQKVRKRVRNAIVEALKNENQVMLITHGIGCVIAYDALWELSHTDASAKLPDDRKVDVWMTLGAPLGDSMVQSRLLGAREKGLRRYPSNVVSWYNISAEDDYLCHDNTLADDFRDMLKQKQVSKIKDYRIYNLAVRFGKSNPHSSVGYLIHPRVAQIISAWLRKGPVVTPYVMNSDL